MRVVQINTVYGEKSTGIIARDIHDLLNASSMDSEVICVFSTEHKDGITELGYGMESKYHALMTRLFGTQGFHSSGTTRSTLKKLDSSRPDIIHLHNVHSNFLNLPMLFEYAAKNNIPVMMTLHDCWFFTGKCYHFLDNGCDRWLTRCHSCPKRKAEIQSLLCDSSSKVFEKKKSMYSSVDLHVVGCSKWVTDCAKQSPLFQGASFHQIYNGADINIFSDNGEDLRGELSVDNEFVVMTMANKWFDPKNENARKAILSYVKEKNCRLLIVGCSNERLGAYPDSENVICLGYERDRYRMAAIYRTADVFLNLTFVDTLPTVNMESALCGTPIVTYNSGGSGELVLNGQTGYVVEPSDTTELIAALEKIRVGTIKRKSCRSFAESNFEKDENYKKYLELYQKIYENRDKRNG